MISLSKTVAVICFEHPRKSLAKNQEPQNHQYDYYNVFDVIGLNVFTLVHFSLQGVQLPPR